MSNSNDTLRNTASYQKVLSTYAASVALAKRKKLPPSQIGTRLLRNPDDGSPFTLKGYEFVEQPLNSTQWRIVIMKSAQVGATVTAQIRAASMLAFFHKSVFYLLPTISDARDFVKARFNTLFEATPILESLFEKSDTVEHKKTRQGVNFYCRGSNSRSRLMSVPADQLIIDEFDECHTAYDISSSQGSWSSIDLVRKRLTGREDSWEMDLSTPTVPEAGIHAEWLQSDQRFWQTRCNHCPWRGHLEWSMVKWNEGEPKTAHMECPRCKRAWKRRKRLSMVQDGYWLPSYKNRDIHGYHMSQLMSPRVGLDEMVAEYELSLGDESKMAVFYNSRLGLPYQTAASRMDIETVSRCCLPESKCLAGMPGPSYMGLDTGSVHHYVIGIHDADGQIAVIARGVLTDVEDADTLMLAFGVVKCCVDAGGEPEAARKLAQRWPGVVYRVNYSESILSDHIYTQEEKHLKTVNRTTTLDAMYKRVRLGCEHPQGIMFPQDVGNEFMQHLCNPQRVLIQTRGSGRIVARYMDSGRPDHYAHSLNYCLVAMGEYAGYSEVVDSGIEIG